MTKTPLRARVVLVGPGIPDDDLGEKLIALSIIEQGRFYAFFEHEGKKNGTGFGRGHLPA
jgi:hypothetical protein